MDDVVFELYGRVQKKRTGVAAAPALCSTASVIPYFRDQRELDPMEWVQEIRTAARKGDLTHPFRSVVRLSFSCGSKRIIGVIAGSDCIHPCVSLNATEGSPSDRN